MANSEHQLTLEFESTGERWDRITEYEIEDSFLVPSDSWQVTVYDPDPVKLRRLFRPLEPVRLYLGDRLQVIGRIDGTQGVGRGSTALRVWGRDYIADLVNPNIDPSVRVTNQMTLADALLEGLRVFGIDTIEGDVEQARAQTMGPVKYRERPAGIQSYVESLQPDTRAMVEQLPQQVVRTPITEKVPDAKPRDGEGAFEWADRLAARAGFTIQPGSSRNAIAVVAPDYRADAVFNFSRPGNIEEATARRDYGDLPTVVITSARAVTSGLEAKGQWREIRAAGDESPASLWQTEEGRRILMEVGIVAARMRPGTSIAPPLCYRPLYHRDDDAKTAEQLERSARRMLADRMRRTLEYRCIVTGHQDPVSGSTYAVNVMASVVDDVEDVNEILWACERRLSYQPGRGEQTELTLIRPASFVL